MEGIVVLFDFDKTVIDVDSDNWVFDELGFTSRFYHLLSSTPWNTAMDMLMREMHAEGVTSGEIVEVLQRIPIHPRIVPTIKAVHSAGCCLRIVSDANRFFIETIVDHLGIRSCFTSIESNPGYVDEQGRLRIHPHQHDFHLSPHGCTNPNCPPNMCKGKVVERIVWEEREKKFIYIGDGKGDYCPSLKLREGDIVMPRTNFPVWELISENPQLLKAGVCEWADGGELETVLLNAIRTLSSSSSSDPIIFIDDKPLQMCYTNTTPVVDHCKLETVPTAPPFSKPVAVPF